VILQLPYVYAATSAMSKPTSRSNPLSNTTTSSTTLHNTATVENYQSTASFEQKVASYEQAIFDGQKLIDFMVTEAQTLHADEFLITTRPFFRPTPLSGFCTPAKTPEVENWLKFFKEVNDDKLCEMLRASFCIAGRDYLDHRDMQRFKADLVRYKDTVMEIELQRLFGPQVTVYRRRKDICYRNWAALILALLSAFGWIPPMLTVLDWPSANANACLQIALFGIAFVISMGLLLVSYESHSPKDKNEVKYNMALVAAKQGNHAEDTSTIENRST